MKNIDRMKESLIRQIQEMNIDDYERLNSALCQKIPYSYGNDTGWCVVDKSAVLTCEECSSIFGKCNTVRQLEFFYQFLRKFFQRYTKFT